MIGLVIDHMLHKYHLIWKKNMNIALIFRMGFAKFFGQHVLEGFATLITYLKQQMSGKTFNVLKLG